MTATANGQRTTHRPPVPEYDVAPPGTADRALLAMQEQIDRAREEGAAGPEGPFKTPVTDALRKATTASRDLNAAMEEMTQTHAPWADELRAWWIETATTDIGGSIQKIAEYGGSGPAYDLLATGHDLAAMNGRRVDDEEAVELAILFYLSSKVNRMLAAAIDGRRGSDDTLLDISYYAFMARRNRVVGGWPVA